MKKANSRLATHESFLIVIALIIALTLFCSICLIVAGPTARNLIVSLIYPPPTRTATPPKDIAELLEEDGRFTILLEALETAELIEVLKSDGPLTGFCPTDAAFARLENESRVDLDALLADPVLLQAILPANVSPGNLTAADLVGQHMVKTAQGIEVAIIDDDGTIKINNAQATEIDIPASNGIIQITDAVLLPVAPPFLPPEPVLDPEIEVSEPFPVGDPMFIAAAEIVPGHPVMKDAVQELEGVLRACQAQINTARTVRLEEGGEITYVAPLGAASADTAVCPAMAGERVLGAVINQGESNFWAGPGPYLVLSEKQEGAATQGVAQVPVIGESEVRFMDANFEVVASFKAPVLDVRHITDVPGAAIVYGSKLCRIGNSCFSCGGIGTIETSATCTGQLPEVPAEASSLPSSAGMVNVPAGTYTVGLEPSGQNHVAPQQVALADFWIDQHEVTNAEYARFLAETNRQPPDNWPGGDVPPGQEDHPVAGVTWDLAAAYCESAAKRLPTEAEWEIAARGPEGRLYPWGDNQDALQLPQSGTYPVGSKLTNQSPFGVFDMAANVWEWVGEPYGSIAEGHRVLRGGSNGFLKDMAYRLHGDPNIPTMFAMAGVRCAADQVNVDRPAQSLAEGVLYQDKFADPGSGWPILSEGIFFFGYHPPDFYHVEVGTANSHEVVSRNLVVDNATIEAEILVDHTNTASGDFRYGLALRKMGEDQFYAFTVSPRRGVWQVLKRSPAGFGVLAEGALGALQGFAPQGFTPNQADTLRVDANGPEFAFHINGQPVARVSDSDYATGEMGFFVENFDETLAHIHYDSLAISELQAEEVVAATPTSLTLAPSPTSTASPMPEPLPTSTNAPEPATPVPVPVPEEMILVPAGSFSMGSSSGQPDEAPPHEVALDAFYIDRFEVSNANYRQCVNAGACARTSSADGFTRSGYRDDPAFDNYPVVNISWDQAVAYCRFEGKRLPTEAEWEYAAKGPDNLTYPWGNTFNPGLSAAGSPDTEPVDSFPGGVSPFGVFNMAGNVNEWVQDVYSPGFYAASPAENPVNTGGGSQRVFRGGSFANEAGAFYRTSRRYSRDPAFSDVDMGFRCALDGP